jgi:hypothetical protein
VGRAACAGLVASVLGTGAAMSATLAGDKPTMQVGEAFTFRTTGGPAPPREWTEHVIEVLDNGRYRARIDGHALPFVEFDGPGNLVQPPPWPTLQLLQFPLTIGKHWANAVADTPAQTRAIDYRVAAVERLRLRVGEHDCLRLDGHETTSVGGASVVSTGTIFYCPALRHIGLRETRIPNVGVVRQELVLYRPAPASRDSSTSPRPATP